MHFEATPRSTASVDQMHKRRKSEARGDVREKMLKNEVQSQYVVENKESRFGSKPNSGPKARLRRILGLTGLNSMDFDQSQGMDLVRLSA